MPMEAECSARLFRKREMRPGTARQEMYRPRRQAAAREDRRPSLHRAAAYPTRHRGQASLSQVHPADRA